MAFLEVLTRCYKRPKMLARNRASVKMLVDNFPGAGPRDGVKHTLLVDEVGMGVGWAAENLGNYAPKLVGEYVWVLDDDDECIYSHLAYDVREIYKRHDPDVVMVRMDHGPRGVLPDDEFWGKRPVSAHIGCSAFVVKREMWRAHAWAWCPGNYDSDFRFIDAIFESGARVRWHDVIASRVQRISFGEAE